MVGVESLLVLAERLEMAVVHPSDSPSEAVATWLSGADVVGAVVDDMEATLSELAAAAGAATRAMEASIETMCGSSWGPTREPLLVGASGTSTRGP